VKDRRKPTPENLDDDGFAPWVVFTPEGHFLITQITPDVERLIDACSHREIGRVDSLRAR
jgi:hypothetical protein